MVSINRSELSKALNRIAITARNSGHESPVMGEVKKGLLKLWYSSFDISIWDEVPVEDDDELTFSSPVETFSKLVSSWTSDTIKLSMGDNNSLIVKSGRSRVTVPYYEGIFDAIEKVPTGERLVEVDATFTTALAETEKFVAKTEDRPSLSCLLIEIWPKAVELMASDAFHFYHRIIEVQNSAVTKKQQLLLPAKSVSTVAKLFSTQDTLRITRADNDYILFANGKGLYVLCAVFNEPYPNISSILEDEGTLLFDFKKEAFDELLSVGSVLSANSLIRFSQSEDSIYVSFPRSTADSEIFLENVLITNKIPDFLHLNISFLKQCIDVLKSENLSFFLMESGAIRLRGEDKDLSTMIMVIKSQ